MSTSSPSDPAQLLQQITQRYVESMYDLTEYLETLEEAKEQYRRDYIEGDVTTYMQATLIDALEKKIQEYRQMMRDTWLLRQEILEEWKIENEG